MPQPHLTTWHKCRQANIERIEKLLSDAFALSGKYPDVHKRLILLYNKINPDIDYSIGPESLALIAVVQEIERYIRDMKSKNKNSKRKR